MGRFQGMRAYETIGPIYNGKGRSAMYLPGGDRPSIQVMYWDRHGHRHTRRRRTLYATTTGRTAPAHPSTLPATCLLAIYTDHWKRTLQMLVLEEIITAHFHFPPEVRQLIKFSRLFLLGHVPVVPIRTAEVIGMRASSGVEVEARKVKMEGIRIISGEAEPEPEVELWTPAQINTELWLDFADEATVILNSGKISQVWISGNLNHAYKQTDPGKTPDYTIQSDEVEIKCSAMTHLSST